MRLQNLPRRSKARSIGPQGTAPSFSCWRNAPGDAEADRGTILFVHGSSMASQPTFDLQVPGRPDISVMDWFAARGLRLLVRRHGRLRPLHQGSRQQCADRAGRRRLLRRPRLYRKAARTAPAPGLRHLVGRAARRAVRAAPSRHGQAARARRHGVDRRRLADAGRAAKKLAGVPAKNRRPIDRAFVHSIFDRDHPGTADENVIEAFADAVLALDDSVPTGTYVDMCSRLPVVDPEKITVPTIDHARPIRRHRQLRGSDRVLREAAESGQAVRGDARHLARLASSRRITRWSLRSLWSFFAQPAPIYRG